MQLQPKVKRFEEVKNGLTGAILEGTFKPGERLPSLRDLCVYFGVSLTTVQRAVQTLKDQDWLISEPCKGISVADPLPPVAHLLRLKQHVGRPRDTAVLQSGQGPAGSGANGTLTCLLYDAVLLPLFEWAAREYAGAYAPFALRFEVRPLPGRDDEESMRSLDTDLVLLPSYAAGAAVRRRTITPAGGMLPDTKAPFKGVPPQLKDLVSHAGELWAVPLMASGVILTARLDHCRRFGIEPSALTRLDALLAALEAAASRSSVPGDIRLFNMTFTLVLLLLAGHSFSAISRAPAMLAEREVRALLERLRALARHPCMVLTRFDQWERIDLSTLAVRHQSSDLFCQDPANRKGSQVLSVSPAESGGTALVAHCLCVSAMSVHPYEAWEWAAHLAAPPFQQRLAALGYQIPVNRSPEVERTFGQTVGEENARALLDLLRRPDRLYGIGSEDTKRYLWEVLSNELYRFVAGLNDYERLRERVETKTERYLARAALESAARDASRRPHRMIAEVQPHTKAGLVPA